MKRTTTLTLFLIAGLFISANAAVAPDFTLLDTDGKLHKLSDYNGKVVVLEWYNSDCPFVKKHYNSGNMQSLQEEYTSKGVVWFSIASSAPGKQGHYDANEHNSIRDEKNSKPTAILLDPKGKVGRAYKAKVTPHMYIIDTEGNIVYEGGIDNKPSANPADIPTSLNYVSESLDALLEGKDISNPKTKAYGCSIKY